MRLAVALLLAAAAATPADAEEAPICTDRPTKANAVCVVPVGTWQLETTAIGWSRTEAGGAETKMVTLGSSVMKLGLSERSDLQLGFSPYVRAVTRASGSRSRSAGVGDLTVRYKRRLTDAGAPVQLALIPFVKLPTADRDLGNGKAEGGLAVPVSLTTGAPVTIVLGPELDFLADGDGNGRHAALVNLINLSGAIAEGVMLYGELWTMTNFDPDGTVTTTSADVAISYLAGPNWQADLGANIGLTKHTADAELYAGISLRF